VATRKRKRRPESYSWSLHLDAALVDTWELSEKAAQGLEWAQRLAESHARRAELIVRGGWIPRLEPADIAEDEGVLLSVVVSRIRLARSELFGSVSLSTIFRRSRRLRVQPEERRCKHENCWRVLPRSRSGRGGRPRSYCDEHQTPAARQRRSRAKAASAD
jgi:hypothetical protein